MLADPDEPYLVDVVVLGEENVYPMIPAGGTYRDIIMNDEEMSAATGADQGSNI
jgi:acetolactate synthase-1/2/3 large subunit